MRKLASIACVALAACAGAKHLNNEIGEQPSNPKASIMAYLDESLRDPDSLKQFKMGRAQAIECYHSGYIVKRWVVSFNANAKNAYGGYTGKKTHYAFFIG